MAWFKPKDETVKEYEIKMDLEFYSENILPYYEDILRYINAMVHDIEVAQDLRQITMLKALNNLKQLKDEEAYKSWLFSIAHNVTIDHFRRRDKDRLRLYDFSMENTLNSVDEIAEEADGILEKLIKKRNLELLKIALEQLDERSQFIVRLRYDEEWSIRKIAENLNLKEGTITSILCRTVKKLTKIYETLERGSTR